MQQGDEQPLYGTLVIALPRARPVRPAQPVRSTRLAESPVSNLLPGDTAKDDETMWRRIRAVFRRPENHRSNLAPLNARLMAIYFGTMGPRKSIEAMKTGPWRRSS